MTPEVQTGLTEKVPSPFIRYRCPVCQRWVAQDALTCICGVLFRDEHWQN